MSAQDILDFWFKEITPDKWWAKSDAFDKVITEWFGDAHKAASQCELYPWRVTAHGRLAEIIVLDQFSRNIYRDSRLAFACDSMALTLTQEAIRVGADTALTAIERSFLYMPMMHSESLAIHDIAMQIYQDNGIETNFEFEKKHREIIEKFGRYPHRNKILGRESTAEELAFLEQPGSSF